MVVGPTPNVQLCPIVFGGLAAGGGEGDRAGLEGGEGGGKGLTGLTTGLLTGEGGGELITPMEGGDGGLGEN
jgi:hypothetical protein